MSTYTGPVISTDGLMFCADPRSARGTPYIGCGAFTGSLPVRDLVGSLTASFGNVLLSNLTYYTAFGIDYPEGSYGGAAANRDGITPGFNVVAGAKTYDAGRALNYYVWNNVTKAWVEGATYFTGATGGGHTYDNYSGAGVTATELGKFVTNYNLIKRDFPDCVHIVIGSHRCDTYSTDSLNVLYDLGMPTGYLTINMSAPEWALVGKPGLGAGNAYAWGYENYSVNPAQVAHVNFGISSGDQGDFTFTGNEYLQFGRVDGSFSTFTVMLWFKTNHVSNYRNVMDCNYGYNGTTGNIGPRLEQDTSGNLYWILSGNTTNNSYNDVCIVISTYTQTSTWYCVAITRNSSGQVSTYLNGAPANLNYSNGNGFVGQMSNVVIGRGFHLGGSERYLSGNVSNVMIYNRALSGGEINQFYSSTRSRFGL